MELRKDVKYMLNCDWEPQIPEEDVILKQAKTMLKKGKSSGKVALDIKSLKDEAEDVKTDAIKNLNFKK